MDADSDGRMTRERGREVRRSLMKAGRLGHVCVNECSVFFDDGITFCFILCCCDVSAFEGSLSAYWVATSKLKT